MIKYYKYASHMSLFICLYMMLYYDVYVEYGTAEFTSSWAHFIIRLSLSGIQTYFSLRYARTWYTLKIWCKPEPESRGEAGVEEVVTAIVEAASEQTEVEMEGKKVGMIHDIKEKVSSVNEKLKKYYEPVTSIFTEEGPKVWDSG